MSDKIHLKRDLQIAAGSWTCIISDEPRNILRMDQWKKYFDVNVAFMWALSTLSTDDSTVIPTVNMHISGIISAEQRSSYQGQWHQCAIPPGGMLVVTHAGTHTAMETAGVWVCIGVKGIPQGTHTHTHTHIHTHTHTQKEITEKQSDRGSPLKNNADTWPNCSWPAV